MEYDALHFGALALAIALGLYVIFDLGAWTRQVLKPAASLQEVPALEDLPSNIQHKARAMLAQKGTRVSLISYAHGVGFFLTRRQDHASFDYHTKLFQEMSKPHVRLLQNDDGFVVIAYPVAAVSCMA